MNETILLNLIKEQLSHNANRISDSSKPFDDKEINPVILDKNRVRVYNGSKLEELTVLTIDASTDLKITSKVLDVVNGTIDYYEYVRLQLKYKIEEIEDVDNFLRTHTLSYVNNIMNEIDLSTKKYGRPKLI